MTHQRVKSYKALKLGNTMKYTDSTNSYRRK